MCNHDCFGTGGNSVDKGDEVGTAHLLECARIARRIEMGVGKHAAVARKVFQGHCHAGQMHSARIGLDQFRGDRGISMERTLAHSKIATGQISHRRKTGQH